VVRESTFQKLSDTPGLIYEEARRTGLLVYECESWPSSRLSAFMARARQERFAYNTDLPLRQWCLAKPNRFSCATSRWESLI
jgi:hypothetical protein